MGISVFRQSGFIFLFDERTKRNTLVEHRVLESLDGPSFIELAPFVKPMGASDRDRMRLAVELVRKGGTMLGEPCSKCGGVRVSYHGKIYCTGHEDLSVVVPTETVPADTVMANLKDVLLLKLNEAATLLRSEADSAKQEQLASLITKYYDLFEKLVQKQQRP